MKFIKSYKVLIAFLLLTASVFAVLYSPPKFRPPANKTECEVYHAFYQYLEGDEVIYFYPYSKKLNTKDIFIGGAPIQFAQETGDMENYTIGEESYERPIMREFEKDTTQHYLSISEKKDVSIRRCFKNTTAKFSSGSLKMLAAKKIIAERDNFIFANRFVVSPIGFDKEKNSALFFVEDECKGLCGSGWWVYLERREEGWKVIGQAMIWIS